MSFCLPKFAAEELIKNLPEDITKLTDISSADRRTFFAKIVGEENAKKTNALFESKLILKDQQQGIINWAKKITGLSPEAKRTLIDKVGKMTEVLQPGEKQKFLEDLAAQKLGMGVTIEEAGKIADLAKKVEVAKENMNAGGDRLIYGRAKVEFSNYVNDLKLKANETTLGEKLKPTNLPQTIGSLAAQTKAIKASLDNSAIFRQGWKTMLTHPGVWADVAFKSISNLVRTLGGAKVMDEVNADIVSMPQYDQMVKGKLAIANMEEAFPSALPEKIPIFGRLYKASEVAFTAFVHKLRADLFNKYLDIAEKSGVDVTDKTQLESIGKMVNSLTGRASLGRAEPAADFVNSFLFSPRFLKSHLDVLTAHQFQKDVTPFVRKQAAINLLKIVAAQAAIMGLANIVQPKSAETDPRSSDFGKIKIGNTRFDISGGASSLVVLAARLLTKESKSSSSGKIYPINSGKFGATTGSDLVFDFFKNKLSPPASVLKDLAEGHDFNGNKATLLNEANNLVTPLPITNFFEAKGNDKAANMLLIMLADGLGVGTNTYK